MSRKLFVLMVTAFVDMLGLLAIVPLLPYYALDFGGNGFIVGLLVASFSVAQLITAPIWGRVSDRYGRRPALLVGLVASGIAYVIFAFATSITALFLCRLVQGAGGGTVGVIQAYVADATEPENRAKALGWLSASTNLGVALGPVLGSAATNLGRAAPGLMAAGIIVLNMTFAFLFLPESHTSRSPTLRRTTSRGAITRVITHSGEPAARLIWIYAIAIGAFTAMTAVFALFLERRYGVTEQEIGYFFMYIGAIAVVTRAFVLGRMVDWLGELKLARIGMLLLIIGLTRLPFTYDYFSLAIAVALVPLGTAFTFPCVTAMLSHVISRHERGLYMGVQHTFGGVARVAGPIWAGFAWDHLGIGVPFWTGAVLVTGTILLSLRIVPDAPQPQPAEAAAGGD